MIVVQKTDEKRFPDCPLFSPHPVGVCPHLTLKGVQDQTVGKRKRGWGERVGWRRWMEAKNIFCLASAISLLLTFFISFHLSLSLPLVVSLVPSCLFGYWLFWNKNTRSFLSFLSHVVEFRTFTLIEFFFFTPTESTLPLSSRTFYANRISVQSLLYDRVWTRREEKGRMQKKRDMRKKNGSLNMMIRSAALNINYC